MGRQRRAGGRGDRCPVAAGNCARASCRLIGKGADSGTGHPASLRSLADHPRGPRAAAPAACHPPSVGTAADGPLSLRARGPAARVSADRMWPCRDL